MAVIEVVESFLFIGLINRNMKSSSRQMTLSENTMKLQKKLMRALYAQVKNLKILKMIFLFQVTVFLLNFQVPIVYILYSVTSNFYSQEANNLVFIVASLHGINSTLIMLFAHKPYRAECEKMIMSGREFFKIPHEPLEAEHSELEFHQQLFHFRNKIYSPPYVTVLPRPPTGTRAFLAAILSISLLRWMVSGLLNADSTALGMRYSR
ncbi:hypothetical protein CRE_16135 [Caenorhabditis remanei]|uniref:Uncharacterized protein n=1 Tax=Caenorhabditis remanei TaxID=31234 RepID=E3MB81_CAERE|nr:hypothetical protein CRE_16135 [Caenorhabditis remanei]